MPQDKNGKAHEEIEHIFRVLLTQSGLVVREEQIALCHVMLDGLMKNNISLCDAGVGIGKTYAYLVACVLIQKYSTGGGRPTVISTSSVALQDAIRDEYIPFLSRVLLEGGIIHAPLLSCVRKGKERFVCDERLDRRLTAVKDKKKNVGQLAALRSLLLHYDLDSVAGLSDFDRRQVCVPKVCPKDCVRRDFCRYHRYLHRAQIAETTIQICNHNYLLADAAHRQQGFHPLLKVYGALIVDEAHKLPDAACQMCGESLSGQDFNELCTLLEREKCGQAASALRKAAERLLATFGKEDDIWEKGRRVPLLLTSERREAFRQCERILQQAQRQLTGCLPRWLIHRLAKAEQTLHLFYAQDSRYILFFQYDQDGAPSLCAVSRDTPKQLRRALWEQGVPTILTSGTLKAGDSFDHAVKRTGLDTMRQVQTFAAPSPFDYEKNCLLFLPLEQSKAQMGSEKEIQYLARQICQLVNATCGHTLILFTSYSLMGAVYRLVRDKLPFESIKVWRHSQDAIHRFKEAHNAVLFAAGSCWEGIDFPGDVVSSLIIPRLPFPVPDPLSEAERKRYFSLQDYIQAVVIPGMQIKLRQGFGRAIRTETDTCVVSILDDRAAPAPGGRYHRAALEALPTMNMTQKIEDVERFIRDRKKPDYFSHMGGKQCV